MSTSVPLKYRAFLSYSHRDTRTAKRLHARLEGFRIDKDIIGRETTMGQIPKTLRPVFRDRHDFDAGGALAAQTVTALDGSAALILLASPDAAKSNNVNEEVRLFKSRHPDRPVIPLISESATGDVEKDCFPPALRFEVGADGIVTDTPATILAADLRETGDGRELALAKVIARLIGLAPDEVFRRAKREQRRKDRVRNSIIAVLALLTVAAIGSAAYAWQQLKTNEAFLNATLKTATEIVNTAVAQATKYNVPRTATLELLTKAEGLFDDMARLGRPTPELRFRKAWMLIEFARNYAVLGDTGKQRARAAEAHRLLVGLADEKPDDAGYQSSLAAALIEVGRVWRAQSNPGEALNSYRDGLAIAERLAKADPNNADWQRALSISYGRVGDMLVEQGNLGEALNSYRDGLGIVDRLAKADPNNTDWQRELSVFYNGVGDVLVKQGFLGEALNSYRDGLGIMDRLAKADPNNAGWQSDLAVSYHMVGDVLVKQGFLGEALNSYRDGFGIMDRLAKADPNNAQWQRDLSVSYAKLADGYRSARQVPEAREHLSAGRAIIARLVEEHPTWAELKRDLRRFDGQLAELDLSVRRAIRSAADNGRYDEALSLEELLAGSIEETETKQEGRAGKTTAGELGNLAWYALFARDFAKALNASERALSLYPGLLWVETNRAHALLFLGRIEEAKTLYLAHKGEKIPEIADKLWERAVAGDFAELRKAGLTNPMIADIEAALGIVQQ